MGAYERDFPQLRRPTQPALAEMLRTSSRMTATPSFGGREFLPARSHLMVGSIILISTYLVSYGVRDHG